MGNLTLVNYDDAKTLEVIKESVAKTASPAEFAYFIEFCKHTGLNPIKREIWFIKIPGRGVQVVTGINGYLAIANSNSNFDGMETEFEDDEQGNPISCTCRVWRKDRSHAHVEKVYMREYNLKQGTWLTKPRTMLAKVAKAHALREAFSQELAGTYIEEEVNKEIEEVSAEPVKIYTYKISAITDENKRTTLVNMLHEKGIETVISNGDEYFESEQRLEKLAEYEVDKIGA